MSGSLMVVTSSPVICAPTNKKIIRIIVDSGWAYWGKIENAIVHRTSMMSNIAMGCEMVGQFFTILFQLRGKIWFDIQKYKQKNTHIGGPLYSSSWWCCIANGVFDSSSSLTLVVLNLSVVKTTAERWIERISLMFNQLVRYKAIYHRSDPTVINAEKLCVILVIISVSWMYLICTNIWNLFYWEMKGCNITINIDSMSFAKRMFN